MAIWLVNNFTFFSPYYLSLGGLEFEWWTHEDSTPKFLVLRNALEIWPFTVSFATPVTKWIDWMIDSKALFQMQFPCVWRLFPRKNSKLPHSAEISFSPTDLEQPKLNNHENRFLFRATPRERNWVPKVIA